MTPNSVDSSSRNTIIINRLHSSANANYNRTKLSSTIEKDIKRSFLDLKENLRHSSPAYAKKLKQLSPVIQKELFPGIDKGLKQSTQDSVKDITSPDLSPSSDIVKGKLPSYPTITNYLQKGIERFLNTPDSCNPATTLVVVICSAVEHHRKRMMIRNTWANIVADSVKFVFLVGTAQPGHAVLTSSFSAEKNRTENLSINQEAERFRDIVRADFVDSYANLTLKSLAMLRWVSTHCATVRFILKCDDDVIINTPLLLRDLNDNVHRRFVMGNVIAYAQPVREPEAKWYIPLSMYNRTAYPTYASGAAYVLSGDIVSELYRVGLTSQTGLFLIEDVFVTGFLAKNIGAQLIYNGKFDGYKEFVDPCSIQKHIVKHKLSDEETRFLWTVINKSYDECRTIYKSVFSTKLR